jgi:hypothetical protein
METKTKTQLDWVVGVLKEHGEISRNYALSAYITRLGSRIYDLKNGRIN